MSLSLRDKLVLDGKSWSIPVGAVTAGADLNPITGGGNGTVIDANQPEVYVGVDAGFYLIPLSVRVSGHVDMDANAEDGDIVAFLDRATAPDTSATATVTAPLNLLDDSDGGASFPGRCYTAVTGDVTNHVVSQLLDAVHIQGSDNGTAANLVSNELKMDYQPTSLTLAAGPCSLLVAWGGVAAVPGMAAVEVAVVPLNYDFGS